jgi:hypothetical protein
MAGKRLSPKDPDTSRPKVSKLLWWDEMRYAWRGRVHAVIQEIDFALGCSADPEMDEAARRLQAMLTWHHCSPHIISLVTHIAGDLRG